jgi:hypothetical protein
MLINDLSHLEVASEDNNIQGGAAFADASAGAYANGQYFAATSTNTYTSASSNPYYYYYYPYYFGGGNSASSSSGSSSVAY